MRVLIPLPSSSYAEANDVFASRPELDAFRKSIVEMGREVVDDDLRVARLFDSQMRTYEFQEQQRSQHDAEREKLYGR